jgi:type IX secretion system PorP/SprF family membrane protein
MKRNKLNIYRTLIVLLFCNWAGTQVSYAQLNPMGAVYFQNQYLANPALASIYGTMAINLGYRKQWSSISGSPSIQTLTGEYALNEKAGVGVNIYNDQSGLFKRTRTSGSFAYHLPVTGDYAQLSFGVSLAVLSERISVEDINGDTGDQSVADYNLRKSYIDGDFGIAFTSRGLNVQAAFPNMKEFFKKDQANSPIDKATFFSAISYRLQLATGDDDLELEPKAVYRGIKGLGNILDAGANIRYAKNLNLFGMYHSTNSSTFGMSVDYKSVGFSGIYTTATSALSQYSNGSFEVSIKIKLRDSSPAKRDAFE